jgi:ABC-2 type transport system permease protein
MMDKIILRLVLFCSKILVTQGVDFERLKIIAETKVLMDRRRVYMNWKQSQQKENSNPLLITLIIYTFLGLLIGSIVFAFKSLILSMIFIHAYVLFMMAMTVITDFSSVLLDTADNQIILPKPVNSKTLFVARLVHILVYLLQFTIALAVFPILFIFIKFGIITGFASIVTILLTVAFAVFITYLLYAVILRFSNEQKVKDIVGYFQIFMTVFFAVGFQILPRLINFSQLEASFTLHTYSYFLPPVWMALTLDALYNFNFDGIHLIMIFCAFAVPVFTFWLMIKYLAPAFARKLAALNNDGAVKKIITGIKQQSKSISEKISGIICSSKTESGSFEMVWKITGRDKNFKLQFYPSLAYILVFIFIFVFKSGQNVSTSWQNLPETKMFLFFIYLPMFSLASSLGIITTHENFQASWIYQSMPIEKPGYLISGGLKAILSKFFILIYLLMFCFAFYVWGIAITDDFVLGFFNNIFLILLLINLQDHYLPFSRQLNTKQQSGKFVQAMLQMIIIAVIVGLHYLIIPFPWLTYCLMPISIFGCYYLIKRIQNLNWLKISF